MVCSVVWLTGCSAEQPDSAGSEKSQPGLANNIPLERWYDDEQVRRGDGLFQTHCAVCHKPDASGTPNWRETDAQGKLPPPPLNGTAHTWHHPMTALRQTIRMGGVPVGGVMPAFSGKLNAEEVDDILAWVQSHWSEEIYVAWNRMNSR